MTRPSIKSGWQPGLGGEIVAAHAQFYAAEHGFGPAFEAVVAQGVAEFLPRLRMPRNGLWTARQDGRLVGSIAIDGEDLGGGAAHLRWFLVSPDAHGKGLGKALLQAALDHADKQGFALTRLWTFAGLDAARVLYERCGFDLVHEHRGNQWGTTVTEQVFERHRPG